MAAAPVGMKRFYTSWERWPSSASALLGLPARQAGHGEHPGERHRPAGGHRGLPRLREGIGRRAGRDHRVRRLPVPVLPDVRHAPDADDRGAADQDRPAPLALPRLPAAAAPVLPGVAAHSAACADEQGKFWPQHERIYEGQAEWAASRDAARIFRRYAGEVGLDLGEVRRLHDGREIRRPDPGRATTRASRWA